MRLGFCPSVYVVGLSMARKYRSTTNAAPRTQRNPEIWKIRDEQEMEKERKGTSSCGFRYKVVCFYNPLRWELEGDIGLLGVGEISFLSSALTPRSSAVAN